MSDPASKSHLWTAVSVIVAVSIAMSGFVVTKLEAFSVMQSEVKANEAQILFAIEKIINHTHSEPGAAATFGPSSAVGDKK